ncbi:hypothetical protein [Acholeplasma laidlawii]
MKAYPKLILRDFKKLYSKFVAIVFIVVIGVAFFSWFAYNSTQYETYD